MAADTDCDLLFGVVALQNGLIDRGRLATALQECGREKGRVLAEHLIARGDLDAEDRIAVEALVARQVKRHGNVSNSLAAVTTGRSILENIATLADPEFQSAFGDKSRSDASTIFGDVDRTLMFESGTTSAADGSDAGFTLGNSTSGGQRFHVLRPHARGGIGAVFVARDGELNREVALKKILDSHADDPISRQRFVQEAEITGGLEHPGIVPVYGLGTSADGRPYYAMRFVRGESLQAAIDAFHGRPSTKPTDSLAGERPTARRRPRPPAAANWRSGSSCGASLTSATPSTTPTAAAFCTATSSPATSSSASTARPWSSTGGWPRRWAGSIPAGTPGN